MYGHDTLFLYFTRRAQQEQVAAINAACPAAEAAHRVLSHLHAAKALLVLAGETSAAADDRVAPSMAAAA